jgi:hypothetical protein
LFYDLVLASAGLFGNVCAWDAVRAAPRPDPLLEDHAQHELA